MHEGRQLCQKHTATTWKFLQSVQGIQSTSSTQLVPLRKCFATTSEEAASRVTGRGSNMRKLWVRNTFEAENSGPYSHVSPICVCPKSGREMHRLLLGWGIWGAFSRGMLRLGLACFFCCLGDGWVFIAGFCADQSMSEFNHSCSVLAAAPVPGAHTILCCFFGIPSIRIFVRR